MRQETGSGPDFLITSVKGPPTAMSGGPFTATVTVCNQGTQGGDTEVELYLSADSIITPAMPGSGQDPFLGRASTPFLAPGQRETLFLPAEPWVPHPCDWNLGAAVDPGNQRIELIEDNNTLTGSRISVTS